MLSCYVDFLKMDELNSWMINSSHLFVERGRFDIFTIIMYENEMKKCLLNVANDEVRTSKSTITPNQKHVHL